MNFELENGVYNVALLYLSDAGTAMDVLLFQIRVSQLTVPQGGIRAVWYIGPPFPLLLSGVIDMLDRR